MALRAPKEFDPRMTAPRGTRTPRELWGSRCRTLGPWALALVPTACGPEGSSQTSVPEVSNLLLISVDTLRADRLGCYGYERPTTPCLDGLAAGGVLFEDASSTSPWTMPSHASLFTGLYPRRSGVVSMRHSIRAEVHPMASLFRTAGFDTAAIVSNSLLTTKGFERDFAFLEEADKGGPHPSAVAERASAWLRERSDPRPFFLFVHFIDPHSDYGTLPRFGEPFLEPYEGPANGTSDQLFEFVRGNLSLTVRDGRHLSNLYDGAVRQLDEQICILHGTLAELGLLSDTLLVITSDHGEEFMEHGGLMHGQTQYEEMLRVPLMMSGPGLPSDRRISVPVSLVDVLPTVLEVLGLPQPAGLDGTSLAASWRGEALPARYLYFEADLDPPSGNGSVLTKGTERAIRDGRHKLHFDVRTEQLRLYDLELDPGELNDLSSVQPELAQSLHAELMTFLHSARAAREEKLEQADLERLQELGYAGEE